MGTGHGHPKHQPAHAPAPSLRFSPAAGWDGEGDGLAAIAQLEDRNGKPGGRITALHLTGGPRVLAYGYTDGNLTEVTSSSGRPLRLAYDDRGRITSWIDTNGSRYENTYDDQDRCIAEGGADGHLALTLTYDEHDPATGERVTAVTTADGHTRRYLIDERCRVVAEIDPLGAVPRYQYDSAGRVLSRTDALGATSLQEYDEAGRITRSIRPDGRIAGRPSTTNRACPQE
ncbi:RHS repeat domain-containing protein [Streptomyces sp. TN58]|uniref:RHS repeat domain-containing protein n=1 Tax=Streptomyces sp. TN58 TaxID=234612 RepID=UPI00095063FE|nr:RHS repeat domain-containing protein [Streptomyces sp. TN58]APU43221.1 hypothetical protein BSL84_29095 [Streptomyces sp. TN58]